jgi:hypothetical protein
MSFYSLFLQKIATHLFPSYLNWAFDMDWICIFFIIHFNNFVYLNSLVFFFTSPSPCSISCSFWDLFYYVENIMLKNKKIFIPNSSDVEFYLLWNHKISFPINYPKKYG